MENHRSEVVNELDCNTLISEIELQSRYHVHFRKAWEKYELSHPLGKGRIVTLFYKHGYGIR